MSTTDTFTYRSYIPKPPAPYIAHPYVLSQTKGLIGRQAELDLLTDWFTGQKGLGGVRIFNVVAIGGMGKSALTWKWFNEIAPQVQPHPAYMAGQMWWSFYEIDGYFENFIIRALAYVAQINPEESQKIPAGQREDTLLSILDREPHLLVLDGLERILIAYARMDAAHIADDDYDKRTANYTVSDSGLSESEKETFIDGHRLRKTTDPRVGNFLRKLTQVRASWILISTRLYPFDLQRITGDPLPGSAAHYLKGLSENDSLDLWREFGCKGKREGLLQMFRSFDNHPLLIQILAGEVANFLKAPFDFDNWRKNTPKFELVEKPKVSDYILEFITKHLTKTERRLLQMVCVSRSPVPFELLEILWDRKNERKSVLENLFEKKPLSLESAPRNLEGRGLIAWNRNANVYDVHPIIRGRVLNLMSPKEKFDVFGTLVFELVGVPMPKWSDFDEIKKMKTRHMLTNWKKIPLKCEKIEDLSFIIDIYWGLIQMKEFEAAEEIFFHKLDGPTLYKFSNNYLRIELLEQLFLDGTEKEPMLRRKDAKGFAYNALALSLQYVGDLKKATYIFEKSFQLTEKGSFDWIVNLINVTDTFRLSGQMKLAGRASENALDSAYQQFSEFNITNDRYPLESLERIAQSQQMFGLVAATIGLYIYAELELSKSIEVLEANQLYQGWAVAFKCYLQLWLGQYSDALELAEKYLELAQKKELERDIIRAFRLQGQASLGLNDNTAADLLLHQALTRARAINFIEEELPTLIALSELACQLNKPAEARTHLDDVWEYAIRGPYPLFHADARNVLCQIERDAGNIPAAIEAATQAYRLAWCDGPPYAYHYGLENAKKHLRELGAPEPEMPKTKST